MQLPVIRGVIDRRLLVNFQVEPEVLQRALPERFRPKLVGGRGIGGVCLIRLQDLRPRLVPRALGLSSENAAHRIAIEWDTEGGRQEGVYIPRRDTTSRLSTLLGGRLFPGVHHRAEFRVTEAGDRFRVELHAEDGETHLVVDGRIGTSLPDTSVFESVDEASDFFERGSLGYSPSATGDAYDALELRTSEWRVEPFDVTEVRSSFFDDPSRFPEGTVRFDCALLMRRIPHEWHARS